MLAASTELIPKKSASKLSTLLRKQPRRDDIFPFFSDAANLEAITPPRLRFSIRTPLPIAMAEGRLIDYRLHLHGVPIAWRTEITAWEPPSRFVDTQLRGPYRWWVHLHEFADVDGGTEMLDRVEWALPLQPLGEIARPVVKRQLERIFDYRERAIREILLG